MLFHSFAFLLFFAIVAAAWYTLPFRWGKLALLAASYFFYAFWNWKFIPLLLILTVIDYVAAMLMDRVEERNRKFALTLSVAANLSFLAFFKYFNFAAANLATLFGKPENAFALDIVLPLGISFHTFQSISYVVDVYRRQQQVIRNPLDYALFIAFFPQLVAGPIVRAREFFADLLNWKPATGEDMRAGAFLFFAGLTKKILFADQFARVSDAYFANVHAAPGALAAWSAALAFGLQIFFDFSGYTDMAIGCARVLGFHFPTNFARPYLALSITEFWRRWHMSLSRWLRDYLYIPLGGNRHGALSTYRNLMLTMLLGGLWHGAAWNFVAWGGWHGALLAIERATKRRLWIFTFPLVLISWVFFRARGWADATAVIGQMFSAPLGRSLLNPWHWKMIVVAALLALLEERWSVFDRFHRLPWPVQSIAIGLMLLILELFAVTDEAIPFVYFQF